MKTVIIERALPFMRCSKCDGTGFISGFMHVDNGKCWMCCGTGNIPEVKNKTVAYAQAFIKQFQMDGFFPYTRLAGNKHEEMAEIPLEQVHCYGAKEHPTAQSWIMKDATYYYVGQPICRASIWYRFPLDALQEFAKYYLKAKKTDIQN